MIFDFSLTDIEDKDGVIRTLRGCPLDKLDELEEKVIKLWSLMASYPDLSVMVLYRCHSEIHKLTNECLELCGLSPACLSIEMIIQLLHHYNTEEGAHKGLLIEQNLPHLAKIKTPLEIIQEGLAALEKLELEEDA